MNSPKPLFKYLTRKKDGVADLVTKARFLGELNKEFLKLVPTPVNQHVQLAYIEGTKLHVIADSPAWATKFRYMSSHLIPTLKNNIQYFQYVKEIFVSTQPLNLERKPPTGNRTLNLSATAKDCLESMADGMNNKDLQQALRNLAKNHKKN